MDSFDGKWLDQELAGSSFADERLGQRFRKLVDQLEGAMGESLPLACQDWANTKAAYRFFSNERVSEAEILAGHFQSTARSAFSGQHSALSILYSVLRTHRLSQPPPRRTAYNSCPVPIGRAGPRTPSPTQRRRTPSRTKRRNTSGVT